MCLLVSPCLLTCSSFALTHGLLHWQQKPACMRGRGSGCTLGGVLSTCAFACVAYILFLGMLFQQQSPTLLGTACVTAYCCIRYSFPGFSKWSPSCFTKCSFNNSLIDVRYFIHICVSRIEFLKQFINFSEIETSLDPHLSHKTNIRKGGDNGKIMTFWQFQCHQCLCGFLWQFC